MSYQQVDQWEIAGYHGAPYTPRELVDTRGEIAGPMPVSFGRVTHSRLNYTPVSQPHADRLLWRAKDKLAEKTGVKHTVYAVNGEQYTGEWLGDRKNGKGVQVYKNGDRYDGMWANGKRHGQGSFYTTKGGRLRLVYTGEWQNDVKWGHGTLNLDNRDRYEGQFVNGQRTGWGTLYYSNGDKYEGEWVNGKREGFGTMHYSNGDRFEGAWRDDRKEGKGTFYYIRKHQRYDGEWVADQPKCGAISEFSADDRMTLPPLELAEPAKVLALEIMTIQKEREHQHEEFRDKEDQQHSLLFRIDTTQKHSEAVKFLEDTSSTAIY